MFQIWMRVTFYRDEIIVIRFVLFSLEFYRKYTSYIKKQISTFRSPIKFKIRKKDRAKFKKILNPNIS